MILHENLEDIALVLTDMVMPKMGGEGFIQALRQQGIMLPVVAMSGDNRSPSCTVELGSSVIAAGYRARQMHFLRLDRPGSDG